MGTATSAEPEGNPPAQEWQRFHPLTPLMRGGLMVLGAIGYVVSQQVDELVGAGPQGVPDPVMDHLLLAAAGTLAVVLLAVLAAWVSWRASRFRVTPTVLEVRTGVLFRQHRHVRFDRVQSVDIRRTLLARLIGLSEVRVVAAGGSDSTLSLAYLGSDRGEELRRELLQHAARARGHDSPAGASGRPPQMASAPGTPEPGFATPPATPGQDPTGAVLVRVPTIRLLQAELASGSTALLLLAIPALALTVAIGEAGVLASMLPAVLAVGSRNLGSFLRNGNFTLARDAGRLTVARGLTDLRSSALPLHRVQAVELHQPLVWRPFGWWRVRANVAGVHDGPDEQETDLLLPVGTTQEALAVLRAALPQVDAELAGRSLTWTPDPAFVHPPRSARPLDPLTWQTAGYAAADHELVLRTGRLGRRAQWVPHARIQSLTVQQGPLQRVCRVASVRPVSTPGSVTPEVRHLAVAEAEHLLEQERERAARARAGRAS